VESGCRLLVVDLGGWGGAGGSVWGLLIVVWGDYCVRMRGRPVAMFPHRTRADALPLF
jgi:hypothetical protein